MREQIENDELDEYHDVDFIEVFISFFKRWVSDKLGEDVSKYPFSHLVKKYAKSFTKQFDITNDEDDDDDDVDFYISRNTMIRLGKELVRKSLYKLPTLRKEQSFTEKFGKFLDRIKKSLGLPAFTTLEFTEPKNYNLHATLKVNFPEMLKSDEKFTLSSWSLHDKISKYLENYLSVKFGNPIYGELFFRADLEYEGMHEWIKDDFNKKIKKGIKQLPSGDKIKKIFFKHERGEAQLKLDIDNSLRWEEKQKIKDSVYEYLTSLGYSRNKFNIRVI